MDTAVCTAIVSATGRDGRATSSDEKLHVRLAFPPVLGGNGQGTNPEQLFAAGWAACFTSTLGVVGREAASSSSRRTRAARTPRPRAETSRSNSSWSNRRPPATARGERE